MLSDPALYQEWRDELKAMSLRIQDMRTALYDELARRVDRVARRDEAQTKELVEEAEAAEPSATTARAERRACTSNPKRGCSRVVRCDKERAVDGIDNVDDPCVGHRCDTDPCP